MGHYGILCNGRGNDRLYTHSVAVTADSHLYI